MAQKRESLIIGSRESILAVRQSEIVMEYLAEHFPEMRCELRTMKTTGDRILTRLDRIGGKGLFVKELDQALREGGIDLSVHSLKDMPMETPEDLPVVGFSAREDPRDVLVLPAGIRIPEGEELRETGALGRWLMETGVLSEAAPVGTSSRRRMLQLRKLFPDARFESVRGNVQTRLRKLDEGQYGALVLAAAGLHRLHLEDRISRYFEAEEIIPPAGQGILALQGRAGEDYSFLKGFTDPAAAMAAAAERAFVKALGGGCTSPIAAFAEMEKAGPDAGPDRETSGNHGEENPGGEEENQSGGGKYRLLLRGFFYDDETEKGFRRSLAREVSSIGECRSAGIELAGMVLEAAGKSSRGRV